VAGSCECGNELSGYIKCGDYLTVEILAPQEGLCSIELVGSLVMSLHCCRHVSGRR
jgi:hypothetical protein